MALASNSNDRVIHTVGVSLSVDVWPSTGGWPSGCVFFYVSHRWTERQPMSEWTIHIHRGIWQL